MLLNKMNVVITNTDMRELPDRTSYCSVGILSMDDGQKFDVSVRDQVIYSKLKPMTKATLDLALTNNGKYGMKLSVTNVHAVGDHI